MAKLHFYYSAMNAGKSTTLLQSSYNYNERGMDTLLYTPIIDRRYGIGKIASRIGLQNEAIAIDKKFNLFDSIKKKLADNPNIHCVLIDEAQFLTKAQIEQLSNVCDFLQLPVLTYGIRSDFRGEPFEGSSYLLAWADNIIELKTICHCGKKATMNLRVNEKGEVVTAGEQIEIGGNEKYVATCRKHFRLRQTGKK
ncbi:MAG: thymidine kinase [Gammaproteobacteria bacterium RIFCSPHIGHO2_02_FULL_39_13]|nr:MAG: thymidine kinase [Gammaproteobacteria bacterium RIFCSPHIGHO2_02_FULL_39_13]OGT48356.1 MAG: thymidine kinase [Gammaproteobacteria bacterium RIFCSPHIGHO2_12_FULL_39_24]